MKPVGYARCHLPSVLFVTSEAVPLAKTGGLGDVCGALPATLHRQGVGITIMIPGYQSALDNTLDKEVVARFGDVAGEPDVRLIEGRMPGSGVPVLLVDAPRLFLRDGGLYLDRKRRDWADNHRRFAVFCHAASRVALGEAGIARKPEIVHVHDWHAGLVPALVRERAGARPRTVLTIHNLAYQGNFPAAFAAELGLPRHVRTGHGTGIGNLVSFLSTGIRYSDRLTTVSPSYAEEILTPEHGCGLDELLRRRRRDLVGILNGVDHSVWCPARDTEIHTNYSAEMPAGKGLCKAAVQRELGFVVSPDIPLIIFVNRLAHQKMADVVLESLPYAAAGGAQIVVHGEGRPELEGEFRNLAARHPANIVFCAGYDESLAHRLHAGADISLTPARFEPCGLTTMYAMCYGAVPVTRPVGGIWDTVVDVEDTGDARGTGFVFRAATARGMIDCIGRALNLYLDRKAWQSLQQVVMKRDFGWERSARRYNELYREMLTASRRGDLRQAAPRKQAMPPDPREFWRVSPALAAKELP